MIAFLFTAILLFITFTPNAIHALLALILLFINFAILLFTIDIAFLGFAYILVYIGAICVLFLYIILLLHLRSYSLMQRSNVITLLLLLVFFVSGLLFLDFEVSANVTESFQLNKLTDLQLFASFLFISHQHYMGAGILLLLLALFLSVFLSTRYVSMTKNITL